MDDGITQIIEENGMEAGIINTDITDEMQSAYLDYAMSVIVSRALPDVRDGLKPVQRRVVYAMQDQNINSDSKFYKCASVVGEVLKKYHPHGDSSVYEALVRMGQDFSLRYPLIWPQGNFGSIDGDPPAAMRYTECKLQKISEKLYADIEKETVNYVMNDLQNFEPTYLPSMLPNLLLNGATGIAVGMATSIPPHNLVEILDGISLLMEKAETIGSKPEKKEGELQVVVPEFSSTANIEDLIKIIKGPDFPTGGTIYDQQEIIQMYATGKGRVVTRAKMDVEENKAGKMRIIISEIPYMVNKATLVEKIANLIKNKKIIGISDLRDESNKKGMRVVIELKKEAVVKKIQNQLYKYTPLQSTFNGNFVALLDNEPKKMSLKMMLEEFIKHRQQVVVRRTLFLLKKAREREHILLGLKIALDNLDEVINLIRKSPDANQAKEGLIKKFALSEIQAQAILDMQLRRLAALERKRIEEELKEIVETIKDFTDLVTSPERIIKLVKSELDELKEKFGDERRTKVVKGKVGEFSEEDLILEEPAIITISKSGYIKRLKEDSYKKQGRGGKGVKGQELKDEDTVDAIKMCATHDWAFFLTNTGKVYKMRVWEVPESSRNAKGTPLVNFLSIKQDESVQAFFTLSNEDLSNKDGQVFFITEKGTVKRTGLDQFENIRSNGIMAINLSEGDNLIYADVTSGKDEILLTTAQGQSIRFSESEVRSMGRSAGGVTGIKLAKGNDKVVGAVIIGEKESNPSLLVVSEKGYGKKTETKEYKQQKRAGSGILTYKVTQKTGMLVSAKQLDPKAGSEDILVATKSGKIIRLASKDIPSLGRATQGVRLINLGEGDEVVSTAVIEDGNIDNLEE